jgi:hypothetical protein
MTNSRTLVLKREALTELTDVQLAQIVGAQGLRSLLCLTDQYRQTCLNCE